jgi:DNA-binding NtrC family response regulator
MPACIVVVHDDPQFVETAVAALTSAGHDVRTYTDTMAAMEALDAAQRLEILITRVAFPPGQPHGMAFANMARVKKPRLRVLFVGLPENRGHTEGIGSFLPLPVTTDELVDAVNRMQADIDQDKG